MYLAVPALNGLGTQFCEGNLGTFDNSEQYKRFIYKFLERNMHMTAAVSDSSAGFRDCINRLVDMHVVTFKSLCAERSYLCFWCETEMNISIYLLEHRYIPTRPDERGLDRSFT